MIRTRSGVHGNRMIPVTAPRSGYTADFRGLVAGTYAIEMGRSPFVQLIGSTTTETGLSVCCEIGGNLYPKA